MTRNSAEPRRAAVLFVFVTVLLDMLAFGMVVPVLPGLVKQFMGVIPPWLRICSASSARRGR